MIVITTVSVTVITRNRTVAVVTLIVVIDVHSLTPLRLQNIDDPDEIHGLCVHLGRLNFHVFPATSSPTRPNPSPAGKSSSARGRCACACDHALPPAVLLFVRCCV